MNVKRILITAAIFLGFSLDVTSQSQKATLEGKNFIVNGESFYPVVMNYGCLLLNYDFHFNYSYGVAPNFDYGLNFWDFECTNPSSCYNNMLTDFQYISDMGFNTVRIANFAPWVDQASYDLYFDLWKMDNPSDPTPSYGHLALDPSNSADPGMSSLLPMYDKILEAASNVTPEPLKVIFIVSGSKLGGDFTDAEVSAWIPWLDALSSYLGTSNYHDALFAYDIFNEPCYFINYDNRRSKEEACDIVDQWVSPLKSNDPETFVTIGSCGMHDVFSFDPTILNLDFISSHYYPHYLLPDDDRTSAAVQDLARIRTANELFWMHEESILPWIVGETGFSASSQYTPASTNVLGSVDGTLSDQGDYVNYQLNAICNCGSSGLSWWWYQDISYPTSEYGRSFGLLNSESLPGPQAEKQPAADNFRNFYKTRAPCPVDYSSTYNSSKVYYNNTQFQSGVYPSEINRYIKDQNFNPIANAVFQVNLSFGVNPMFPGEYFGMPFNTLSAKNGEFRIIPARLGSGWDPTNPDWGFQMIQVSAPGAERITTGWHPKGTATISADIILNRIIDDEIVDGEHVYNTDNEYYSARKALTVSNTIVDYGGIAEFVASKEVVINPGFEAEGETNIHIEYIPSNCNDYANLTMQQKLASGNSENSNSLINYNQKIINLGFKGDDAINIFKVYPNPVADKLYVECKGLNCNRCRIYLYNMMGVEVISSSFLNTPEVLNTQYLIPGVYTLLIDDGRESHPYKILKTK